MHLNQCAISDINHGNSGKAVEFYLLNVPVDEFPCVYLELRLFHLKMEFRFMNFVFWNSVVAIMLATVSLWGM